MICKEMWLANHFFSKISNGISFGLKKHMFKNMKQLIAFLLLKARLGQTKKYFCFQ